MAPNSDLILSAIRLREPYLIESRRAGRLSPSAIVMIDLKSALLSFVQWAIVDKGNAIFGVKFH